MSQEPLEELHEMTELEPLEEEVPALEEAAATSEGPGAKPAKRELEQVPLVLRKAAKILLIGSLFPWLAALKPLKDDEGALKLDDLGAPLAIDWGSLYIAKALALLAVWIFHQGFMATHGGKAAGVIDKLAKTHGMTVTILAGLVAIGSFVPLFLTDGIDVFAGIGEVATLILAGVTFTHIFDYEHGGKFNPIYPLMFLGPGIAGLLGIFGAVNNLTGDGSKGPALLGLIGTVIVGLGGLMAIYTMSVAMKQAKIEGDLKKAAALERRKAARAASRKKD